MNTTYIKKPDILKWYIYKILLIMRLTTVILMVSMFQVSASTVAQEFNYVKKGVSIIQIFKEIKKQTGYNIIWNEKKIDVTAMIDANFKKATIQDVLHKCLSNLPLSYSINDKMVMIKEEEPSFRDKIISFFTAIDVRGRVLNENNAPLMGAVVKVKGSPISTATNSNGEFVLRNVDGNAVLVISFIGYETQEINAAEKLGNIQLIQHTGKLEEVEINAGYYTVTERERTGSISRITSKDIEKQPVNNVLQAMQANIPGVQITQNTGIPGGGFSVQVRGRNSISQGSEPLYIIDGVPFTATSIASFDASVTRNASPLASINPMDIESIEVLKDADATAIYGSRGANGVVLITTKRGKADKTRATLAINHGISRVSKKIDLMNTEQYLEMRKEAIKNDNLTIAATDYDLNGKWNSNRYTDWQEELIGGAAPNTNILASVSGGADNITYSIGGNIYNEGTVFPGKSSFNRSSGNFSLQYSSDNKKLDMSSSVNYSQIKSNLTNLDLTQFITLPPNYPSLINHNGQFNWEDNTMYVNPIANTQRPFDANTSNLISHFNLRYKILPKLAAKASFGYTKMIRDEFSSDPLTTFSPAFNYGPNQRTSRFANSSTSSGILETQIDWSTRVADGDLNMFIGGTLQENLTDGEQFTGTGYNSDALMKNIGAASILSVSSRSYLQYRYIGAFGRINYNFKNRYIFNLTARRDGSSRFGTDNRFANFGAIGAAWIISDEKFSHFFEPFVSFAKLRGSYGITGNDRISDYGYLNLWNTYLYQYQSISTMSPTQLANPEYAWEINKKLEASLELGFLDEKLSIAMSFYSNISSNQLVQTQLPPSTGFSGIRDNIPAKIRNTGWEFDLSSKNISNPRFKWTTSINLTIPDNKLIDFPGLQTSTLSSLYKIGNPLSINKLYNTFLDPASGLYRREDYDKNGILDNSDRYVIGFLGRKYFGGVQNSFSYKRFSLDFLIQFVRQSGGSYLSNFASRQAGAFSPTFPISNQPKELLDRWQGPGSNAPYQKFSTKSDANLSNFYSSSFGSNYMEELSFFRLKNVSLSYDFSNILTKYLALNSGKIYFQGQNVFTVTKYKGLDPETRTSTFLPALQVLIVGLQITL